MLRALTTRSTSDSNVVDSAELNSRGSGRRSERRPDRRRSRTARNADRREQLRRSLQIESLETRTVMTCDVPALVDNLLAKVEEPLNFIQASIDGTVYANRDLPYIGERLEDVGKWADGLASELKGVFADVRNLVDPSTPEALLETKIAEGLQAAGLLRDSNGDGVVDAGDVDVILDLPNCGIEVNMDLGRDFELVELPLDFKFDVGLDSVPIYVQSTGALFVEAAFDYRGFGLKVGPSGVELKSSTPDEVTFALRAGFEHEEGQPPPKLDAVIGFLQGTLSDGNSTDPQAKSGLEVGFKIDIQPNFGIGFDFNEDFYGHADLYLQAQVSLAEFPLVNSDIVLTRSWGEAPAPVNALNPADGGDAAAVAWVSPAADDGNQNFAAPDEIVSLAFENVRLSLGEYANEMLGPVVKAIQAVTEPIQPLIDMLDEPLPVLSDLGELVGAGEISLLDVVDVANNWNSAGYKELVELATVLIEVIDFANGIQLDNNDFVLQFGDFEVPDVLNAAPATPLDQFDAKSMTKLSQLNVDSLSQFDFDSIADQLRNSQIGQSTIGKQIVEKLDRLDDGLNYSFPILDNPAATVFKLLVGQDSDLFTLEGQLSPIEGHFDQSFGLPIGIDARLEGSLAAEAYFQLGYDTFGLRSYLDGDMTDPSDLLDGIYLDKDTRMKVSGHIAASASATYVVFDLGAEGGVSANIEIKTDEQGLTDLDGDLRKIRRTELGDCMFRASGDMSAYLDAWVKIGAEVPAIGFVGYEESFPIAHATLFDFADSCIPNPFRDPPAPKLASYDSNNPHTLRLNIGPHAGERTVGAGVEQETYLIRHVASSGGTGDSVLVTAFGVTERFDGITKIVGNAGTDRDVITIEKDVAVDIELIGGAGDDQLISHSFGDTVLRGGEGDDRLEARGAAVNVLYGELGNDELFGGPGENHLFGGDGIDNALADGDDELTGGDGVNTLDGENGHDLLIGGKGQNSLYGREGNDVLLAGPRFMAGQYDDTVVDMLDGGLGDDQLSADRRANYFGGGGDDSIVWRHGDGTPGTVDGGAGYDVIGLVGTQLDDNFALSKDVSGPRTRADLSNGQSFLSINAEQFAIEGLGGADRMIVHPLTSTHVRHVGVNLTDLVNAMAGQGDNLKDQVFVNGRMLPDAVTVDSVQAEILPAPPGTPENPWPKAPTGGVMRLSGIPEYTVVTANVNDRVVLSTLDGADAVSVLGITGPTDIVTGGANDVISLAPHFAGDPATPGDFIGELNIQAGSGQNQLNYDASAGATSDAVVLTAQTLAGSYVPMVRFQAIGGDFSLGVNLTGTAQSDQFDVRETLAGVTTSVMSLGGNDVVRVSSDAPQMAGSLDKILGTLVVDLGGGQDNELYLADRTPAAANSSVTLGASSIAGLAGPGNATAVSFKASAGEMRLTIDGSDFVDNFQVVAPLATTKLNGRGGADKFVVASSVRPVELLGGNENDQFLVGRQVNLLNKLDGIGGAVSIVGQAGQDSVLVEDQAAVVGQAYELNGGVLARSGAATIGFDPSVETVTLLATGFNDSLHVVSSGMATQINADLRGGTDKTTGPDEVNLWNVDGLNHGVLNGLLTFQNNEHLAGGGLEDTFRMLPSGMLAGAIDGGAGADRIDYASFGASVQTNLESKTTSGVGGGFVSIESLRGGAGGDTLIGTSPSSVWQLTGVDRGVVSTLPLGAIGFESYENLMGGANSDVFVMGGIGVVSGWVNGAGGVDRLDYTGAESAVTVSLASSTATRVGGAAFGIENVTGGSANDLIRGNGGDNVLRGGPGNDIVLGGGGADQLFGDGGRDLLIGGVGQDQLFGGDDDDILIAGGTNYDANDVALNELMSEWSKVSLSAPQRIAKLRTGVGANATTRLSSATVLDDFQADQLTGGDGHDWFWAKLAAPLANQKDSVLDMPETLN